MSSLAGRTALVAGVANDQSIAWGCARALAAEGCRLAVTYLNAKAEPHVRPLAESVGADLVLPLDVSDDAQTDAVFAAVAERWGRLDALVHSLAFCPKDDLHGRVVDCSRDGFRIAMDVSCHSFLRMVRLAEPLMADGGACMTVTYQGSERVVEHYNVMGPVKAALEAAVRYAAAELGPKGITVNALSPGPLRTRAASGIDHFDALLEAAAARAPTHQLASIDDVGAFAAFLAGPRARNVTGGVHHIDGGYHVMG